MPYEVESLNCHPGKIMNPVAKPPLLHALSMLEASADNLRANLDELVARLDPVMNQIPTTKQPTPLPPSIQPGNSPTVARIHQVNVQLESLSDMLATIRMRLEV